VRTTVTLDPDSEALIRRAMRERQLSFKDAVNLAIRRGLQPDAGAEPYRTPTFDLGEPKVDLTKALHVAGEMEDEELIRKLHEGR
jgi:hypothetical protein